MPSIDYRDVKTCPHTRGDDPELPMSVVHRKALVPIRVGMILSPTPLTITPHTCPHTRGDDPIVCGDFIKEYNLSPYAWG